MAGYIWRLACGEDNRVGQAPTIADGLADLRGALHEWAATSAGDEVEGSVTGPAAVAPFWIGWGPLGPARGGTDRATEVRCCIDDLIEDIRTYLHQIADLGLQPPEKPRTC